MRHCRNNGEVETEQRAGAVGGTRLRTYTQEQPGPRNANLLASLGAMVAGKANVPNSTLAINVP